MKAEELMKGDWVLAIDTIGAKRCIARILELKDVPYLACGIWGEIHKYELLEPIPLTYTILEKNGFSVDRTEPVCVADGAFVDRPVYKCAEPGWFVEFDGWTLRLVCDLPEREITMGPSCSENIYVHELQHALKLCGIDKEITL